MCVIAPKIVASDDDGGGDDGDMMLTLMLICVADTKCQILISIYLLVALRMLLGKRVTLLQYHKLAILCYLCIVLFLFQTILTIQRADSVPPMNRWLFI